MDVSVAAIWFYPVNRTVMRQICQKGLKTSPEFFGRYEDTFDSSRKGGKHGKCARITLSAKTAEDVFVETGELLTQSGALFRELSSQQIRFTVDWGFLNFEEMDEWLAKNGTFTIDVSPEFCGRLAPFACDLSFSFFCTPPEIPCSEAEDVESEMQQILANHWFREEFGERRKPARAFLYVHHLNEAAFPAFAPVWRLSEGEYRLPFPERMDWYDVGISVSRAMARWEPFFADMKTAGASFELSLFIPREEQEKYIRTQFGLEEKMIRILHRLEIPFRLSIVKNWEDEESWS